MKFKLKISILKKIIFLFLKIFIEKLFFAYNNLLFEFFLSKLKLCFSNYILLSQYN